MGLEAIQHVEYILECNVELLRLNVPIRLVLLSLKIILITAV